MRALFPPPYYDLGYRILLELTFKTSITVGSINHVGAWGFARGQLLARSKMFLLIVGFLNRTARNFPA